MRFKSPALASLNHRDFRLLWTGQLLSTIGTKMQEIALLWHITLVTPDNYKALALGFFGLTKVVPIVIFSLISGIFADTFNRRKLMFMTQSGMMLASLILFAAIILGLQNLFLLYFISTITAIFSAFDAPARQSLIPQLVPAADYPNALSLNSVMMKTAAVLGPALGGIFIAVFGVQGAYLFNAFSFLTVLTALLRMSKTPNLSKIFSKKITLQAVLEGFKFVFTTPLIRSTMLLDFFASIFASATVLLPLYAQDILHVGPHGYGWLAAASAIGSMITSILLARYIGHIRHRGWVLLGAILIFGFANIGFGVSRFFWLTFIFLAIAGAADTVSTILRSIIRQLNTPDRLRGRMVSVNMIFNQGGPQIGELEAGLLASAFTAPISVISGGAACLIFTILIAWKGKTLRNYKI